MLSPAPVTIKASLPAAPLPTLPTHGLLAVEGTDAQAFLQAQLMNDVRALSTGQWQWNGWLSPKGRLIALMALLRAGDEQFVIVLPDFAPSELQARLQRFVFRSKVRLQAMADWVCAAETAGPWAAGIAADIAVGDQETGWRLDMGSESAPRSLWLLPGDSPQIAAPDLATTQGWISQDLAHGLPRLPPEGSEAWTPHMLSLQRLRAFSLAKGCYPGQEILARTHYLGKAKRGLVRLSGTGLQAGQAIAGADGALGEVACARPDSREGLAVVALDRIDEPMSADGQALTVLPLAEGLARPV